MARKIQNLKGLNIRIAANSFGSHAMPVFRHAIKINPFEITKTNSYASKLSRRASVEFQRDLFLQL